jgi:hypothetical protein
MFQCSVLVCELVLSDANLGYKLMSLSPRFRPHASDFEMRGLSGTKVYVSDKYLC